ncbi:family 43 glycosylhydrolase [Halosimplex aquaticum]|uniref:Family 43 glycosylhydrolase n=1 Tax=Halosimplex aquaticum TaxID=3026162 RepID=A0ABD5Y3X4_9EURY|nr:family 43 glycosylhydrolase [Halosimplex aquaticum]
MTDSHDSIKINRRNVLKAIGAGTLAAGGVFGTSGSVTADPSSEHYHNPVGPVGFGDVSIIEDGGTYYAYGTETPNDIIPIAESSDMVEWSYIGAALSQTPGWHPTESDPGCWAPDIRYHDGQYHLYYSLSVWGSDNAGIGLATSDTPDGPFTDQGPVIQSSDLDLTNCIDADTVIVDGQPWMVWGSYEGIYAVQLNDAMDDIVPGTEFHMAGDSIEGPVMLQANGYWYLIYSSGQCCEGYDSTYRLECGRATSFTGPYYNQNGTDLRDLSGSHDGVPILEGNSEFTGPGHNDVFWGPHGDLWCFYHVEATADDETRYMMMDRIEWDDNDWPVIACNGEPSSQAPVPGQPSGCDSGGSSGAISDGTYHIANVNSGKLMEVASAGTADGDNVQQYADTGHACQDWNVTSNGDGTYTLTNVNSGKLLEVASAGTADGDNIQQYADTGHACQDWTIEDAGSGQYRLVNANSGKVAEVASAGTADGDNVQQWADNGGNHQLWTFTSV